MAGAVQIESLSHPVPALQRSDSEMAKRVNQVGLAIILVGIAGAFACSQASDQIYPLVLALASLAAWRLYNATWIRVTPEKIKQQFEDLGYPFYFQSQGSGCDLSDATLKGIREALDRGVADWGSIPLELWIRRAGTFPIQFVGVAAANGADPDTLTKMMCSTHETQSYSTAEKILTVVNRGGGDVAKQIIEIAKKDKRPLNFYHGKTPSPKAQTLHLGAGSDSRLPESFVSRIERGSDSSVTPGSKDQASNVLNSRGQSSGSVRRFASRLIAAVTSLSSKPVTPEEMKEQFDSLGYPFWSDKGNLFRPIEVARRIEQRDWSSIFSNEVAGRGCWGKYPVQMIGVAAAYGAPLSTIASMLADADSDLRAKEILDAVQTGGRGAAEKIINIVKYNVRNGKRIGGTGDLNFTPQS